jgi:hypothetical protein
MAVVLLVFGLASLATLAAEPPELLNYQGVLRNDVDEPLDGTFEMIFRYFSEASCQTLLLTERHTSGASDPVVVTKGLFTVALGSGALDPPDMPLARLFAEHDEVWIMLEIEGEELHPAIRVHAAAYALNAASLGGRGAGEFVDTGPDAQVKAGRLDVEPSAQHFARLAFSDYAGGWRSYGVRAGGEYVGGLFENVTAGSTSLAYLSTELMGVEVQGSRGGGYFQTSDSAGAKAYVAYTHPSDGPVGVWALGATAGAIFEDLDGSGFAQIAVGDTGVKASGDGYAVYGTGGAGGAYFADSNQTGEAWLAYGDDGLQATGQRWGSYITGYEGGGYFRDRDQSAQAWIAQGDYGIRATGSTAGGSFNIVEITGGTDLAEPFDLPPGDPLVVEGAVVVIDGERPGALRPSQSPYDRRVAGVISGAGGVRAGILLSQGEVGPDQRFVALAGRVYCLATTENGPIRPGDLLTTSSRPGRAMRASDPDRSHGAILGKAMGALDEGEGLVLALVSLQ